MDIKAFKMDGLGNDFVIVDRRKSEINLTKEQIIKIGDRNNVCLLYTSPSPRD